MTAEVWWFVFSRENRFLNFPHIVIAHYPDNTGDPLSIYVHNEQVVVWILMPLCKRCSNLWFKTHGWYHAPLLKQV